MPKLGMGPIRRQQICHAAAAVVAREGFAGTTMRLVAEEAGVSTGMLNHYYANRAELLRQALVHVSERSQERYERAMEGVPPGVERLEALLDSVLGEDEEALETWRVWINATGEAVRLPALRRTIEERLGHWFDLVDLALEGLVEPEPAPAIPWAWRVDALLTGSGDAGSHLRSRAAARADPRRGRAHGARAQRSRADRRQPGAGALTGQRAR